MTWPPLSDASTMAMAMLGAGARGEGGHPLTEPKVGQYLRGTSDVTDTASGAGGEMTQPLLGVPGTQPAPERRAP